MKIFHGWQLLRMLSLYWSTLFEWFSHFERSKPYAKWFLICTILLWFSNKHWWTFFVKTDDNRFCWTCWGSVWSYSRTCRFVFHVLYLSKQLTASFVLHCDGKSWGEYWKLATTWWHTCICRTWEKLEFHLFCLFPFFKFVSIGNS